MNDCISRQAVLNIFSNKGEFDWVLNCAVEKIKELPPVTPTRQKGQWIEYNYPGSECVYCSNCKEQFDTEYLYLGGSKYPNYCPHCGADMREGEA